MGYFSNSSEGAAYEAKYCNGCIHDDVENGNGCPILLLHLLYNYDECNNKDSFLHVLIPRSKDGIGNEQCTMYLPRFAVIEEAHP